MLVVTIFYYNARQIMLSMIHVEAPETTPVAAF